MCDDDDDDRVISAKEDKQPIATIAMDGRGVVRFKQNKVIRHLVADYDSRHTRPFLNQLPYDLYEGKYNSSEYSQFSQLTGYSVSGYGDLSNVDSETIHVADDIVELVCSPNSIKQDLQDLPHIVQPFIKKDLKRTQFKENRIVRHLLSDYCVARISGENGDALHADFMSVMTKEHRFPVGDVLQVFQLVGLYMGEYLRLYQLHEVDSVAKEIVVETIRHCSEAIAYGLPSMDHTHPMQTVVFHGRSGLAFKQNNLLIRLLRFFDLEHSDRKDYYNQTTLYHVDKEDYIQLQTLTWDTELSRFQNLFSERGGDDEDDFYHTGYSVQADLLNGIYHTPPIEELQDSREDLRSAMHRTQPIVVDHRGDLVFQKNQLVVDLLALADEDGCGLQYLEDKYINEPWYYEDHAHLQQLLGIDVESYVRVANVWGYEKPTILTEHIRKGMNQYWLRSN